MANFLNIKDSKNVIAVQNKYIYNGKLTAIILTVTLIISCLVWKKEAIFHLMGRDKVFSREDLHFKILILPFKQLCENNRDVGYELNSRLQSINDRDTLLINSKYLNIAIENNFNDSVARFLQEYHNADVIIYGKYMDSGCTTSAKDEYCLNYLVNKALKISNTEKNFVQCSMNDIGNGKLTSDIESVAYFLKAKAAFQQDNYHRCADIILENIDFESNSEYLFLLTESFINDSDLENASDYNLRGCFLFDDTLSRIKFGITTTKIMMLNGFFDYALKNLTELEKDYIIPYKYKIAEPSFFYPNFFNIKSECLLSNYKIPEAFMLQDEYYEKNSQQLDKFYLQLNEALCQKSIEDFKSSNEILKKMMLTTDSLSIRQNIILITLAEIAVNTTNPAKTIEYCDQASAVLRKYVLKTGKIPNPLFFIKIHYLKSVAFFYMNQTTESKGEISIALDAGNKLCPTCFETIKCKIFKELNFN